MKTILALDYGLARIGVAISRVGLAEPVKIIHNDLQSTQQAEGLIGKAALAELLAMLEAEKVDLLLVGVSERAMAKRILAFVDLLKTKTDLPKKKRQAGIDHYAAAIILENYLEMC